MCLLAKKRKGLKSVWPKVGGKNWNYLFYPSAKSRRELKIKTLGVTFRGASAYYVQKSIAPQKQAVCRFSDEFFFDENFHQNFLPKKNFRRRKMKCWESSETRFPKVWGRTEPSSRGKRPVKVLQNFGGNFRQKFDAIIRAQGFQNWQKCPLIFRSIIRGGRMIRQLIIRNQQLSSGFSLSSALIS